VGGGRIEVAAYATPSGYGVRGVPRGAAALRCSRVPRGGGAGDDRARLTQDELDTRVGLALASRTYADLADLTADIPAGPAAAGPAAAEPAATPARTLTKAARRSGICMLVAFALAGVIALTNAKNLVPLAFFSGIAAVIAASGLFGVRDGRRLAAAAFPRAAAAAAARGWQGR
jgi:Domain of unknown function (DUF1707)